MAHTVAQLFVGDSATVLRVEGDGPLVVRLLEMGFVPGSRVTVVKEAPFGDPLELRLRGYHVSLRRGEAARIEVRR